MKLQISRMETQWLIHQKSIDGKKSVGKISFTHPTNPVISLFNENLVIQVKQLNDIIKVALISNGQVELSTIIEQGRQLNKFTWTHSKDPSLNVQVIQKNDRFIAKQKEIKIAHVSEITSIVSLLEIDNDNLKPILIMGCFIPFFF